MTEGEWNGRMQAVGQAYEDLERAAWLEELAYAVRWHAIRLDQRPAPDDSARTNGGTT